MHFQFAILAALPVLVSFIEPGTGTLLDLLPEGVSVVAVVAVVILFLKHQRDQSALQAKRWTEAQEANALAAQVAQESFDRSLGRVVDGHRDLASGINTRLDELVTCTRETGASVSACLGRLDRGSGGG